ncbi:CMRF35-like molecule 1 [Athene cunicularia]|uniref:CMRF35-like molecule 1 n=1 Tax=Athene cunicularia TaxID=194338 RepID=UPI000EF73A39|nr:CMRF35-like molecule 1 [Athene cunicularia]
MRPAIVRGYVGGSVSVSCAYRAGQEMKPKFWCYPGAIFTCSDDIIITSSEQPVVQQDRFSIRDSRTRRVFTVTMERLTEGDAGMYICGVRTGTFQADESHVVKVIVDAAPPSISPPSPYTLPTSSLPVPTQTTPPGKVVVPGSNHLHHGDSSPPGLNTVEHILTPGIAVVLLLLVVAAVVLVILSRKRKKALSRAAVEMDRIHSTSHTERDALNYAEIKHVSGTAESQLYSNTEAVRCLTNTTTEYMEVKQSNQCLEKEKETTYASTQNSLLEQQEIYVNVPSAPARRE